MPTTTYITQIERESADCTTAIIKDYTDYGVDDAPVRNTIGLFVKLVKRSASDPPIDTPVTIDNSSPLSVGQWTIDITNTKDGWYYMTLFGYPIWTAGTYDQNKCVLYSNGNCYRAKATVSSLPTVSADWELITDPTSTTIENLEDSGIYLNSTHNFTTCNAEIPVSDQLEILADQITDGRPKDWEDTTLALLGKGLLNGAWVNHYRVKNQKAQVVVDFLNQKYPDRI